MTITAHQPDRIKDFNKMKPLEGFQFRYIYLIDKTCKISCGTLNFSEIDKLNAGMYKGKKVTVAERKVVKGS